ncbi:MAG: hypothetical protein R2880_06335 [Deinococcales bacterium]
MKPMRYLFLLIAILSSCQPSQPPTNNSGILFRFEDTQGKSFYALTEDEGVIARARAELSLNPAQRHLHPNGAIAAGNGDINTPWNWHFVDSAWDLVEVSIELCDGNISLVEANLDYWLNSVKFFCPWGGRIVEEMTGFIENNRIY